MWLSGLHLWTEWIGSEIIFNEAVCKKKILLNHKNVIP